MLELANCCCCLSGRRGEREEKEREKKKREKKKKSKKRSKGSPLCSALPAKKKGKRERGSLEEPIKSLSPVRFF